MKSPLLIILYLIISFSFQLKAKPILKNMQKRNVIYLKYANNALARFDYKSSEYFFRKVLEINDTSFSAWKGILQTKQTNKKIDNLTRKLSKIVKKNKEDDKNTNTIALYFYLKNKLFQEAEIFQNRIIKDKSTKSIFKIIKVMINTDNSNIALIELNNNKDILRNTYFYYYYLYLIHLDKKLFVKAAKDSYLAFEISIKNKSSNTTNMFYKTNHILMKLSELAEEDNKEKIINFLTKKNNYYSLLFASEFQFKQNKFNEAYKLLQKADSFSATIKHKPYSDPLLSFAKKLKQDQEFNLALKFYHLSFKDKLPKKQKINEYLDYLNTGFFINKNNNKEFINKLTKLENSNLNLNPNNKFKIAVIYKKYLKNYQKAYNLFTKLIDYPGIIGLKSLNKIGEMNVFSKDFIKTKIPLENINLKLRKFTANNYRNRLPFTETIFYLKMLDFLQKDSIKLFCKSINHRYNRHWGKPNILSNNLIETADFLKQSNNDNNFNKIVIKNLGFKQNYEHLLSLNDINNYSTTDSTKKTIVNNIKYNYLRASLMKEDLYEFVFSLNKKDYPLIFLDFCNRIYSKEIKITQEEKLKIKNEILNLITNDPKNIYLENLRIIYRRI